MAGSLFVIEADLAEIAEFLRAQPACAQTREWRASAAKYRQVVESWRQSVQPTSEQVAAMDACVTQLHEDVVASAGAPTVVGVVAQTTPDSK